MKLGKKYLVNNVNEWKMFRKEIDNFMNGDPSGSLLVGDLFMKLIELEKRIYEG